MHQRVCLVMAIVLAGQTWLNSPFVSGEETSTKSLEAELTDVGGMLMKKMMPVASELATSPELSPECAGSLFKILKGTRAREPWAIRMILANGLLPNNILEGSLISLGGYEQCLKTRVFNSEGEVTHKGQYCTLFVYPPWSVLETLVKKFQAVGEFTGRLNPLTVTTNAKIGKKALRIGLCTLNSCTEEEVKFLAAGVFKQYGANTTVTGCRTDDPKKLSKLQYASIYYLSVLGLLLIIGTLIEWIVISLPAPDMEAMRVWLPLRWFMYFSAISNTKRLLKTTARKDNQNLVFLSGFKVFLIFWVIYAHCYVLIQPEFARTPFIFVDLSEKVLFQLMLNGLLSVSTFLFLSGFVMSYLLLQSREVVRKQNPIAVYIIAAVRRYVRLMIPIATVVMACFLLPHFADGPADQELLKQQVDGCIQRWWAVLLSFNNFYPVDKMCMIHLWYVSTDVQIFLVIAFPLTILFVWHPKFALLLSCAISLAFCILVSLQTHFWHLAYSATASSNDMVRVVETIELVYFRPFTHVATYILGVVAGYLTMQYGKVKIGVVMQLAQWIISLALTGFVLFITLPWNRGNPPDDITTAIYGGFHRLVWSVGLVWPAYACATGRGGLLNAFFSWKAFLPLSRLVYCIYLVHVPLLYLRMGILKTHISLNEFFQLNTAIGLFGMSLFLAYLLYLSTEAPVTHFERLIFEGKRKDAIMNSVKKPEEALPAKKTIVEWEKKKDPLEKGFDIRLTMEQDAKMAVNEAGVDNKAFQTDSEKSKL
ncbi:nose resistant to fluoxetine protein 6 isoform X2 [Rhipicephalus microplus]|uniref:nose resistant to fluoxetine protein 6 isoform X2 n=1 Tax=Rhipicephalus microplus TaxID=6941 RepID=UPI003F6C106D